MLFYSVPLDRPDMPSTSQSGIVLFILAFYSDNQSVGPAGRFGHKTMTWLKQ